MRHRISIRPPAKSKKFDINEEWQNTLEPVLKQILEVEDASTIRNLEYSKLYDICFWLVVHGHGKTLFRKAIEVIQNFLQNEAVNVDVNNPSLLLMISQFWRHFESRMKLITDIFLYMESNCSINNNDGLLESSRGLVRDLILLPALPNINRLLFEEINKKRITGECNTILVKDIITLLQIIPSKNDKTSSLFGSHFISELKESTRAEYAKKLSEISTENANVQIKTINSWLVIEESVCSTFYPDDYSQLSLSTVESIVSSELPRIFSLDSAVTQWVKNEDLKMFEEATSLQMRTSQDVQRNDGVIKNDLIGIVSKQLRDDLKDLNADFESNNDPKEWVERWHALWKKYEQIAQCIQPASESKQIIYDAQKQELSNYRKTGSHLAYFVDSYFKKSSDITDKETVDAMKVAMSLFAALSDKDEFIQVSQRLLARRLINNSSRDKNYERKWLQDIKMEDPSTEVGGFVKMIDNIEESKAMFHGSHSISPSIIPTNVNVLSKLLWPKSMQPQTSYNLRLPEVIEHAKKEFENMYSQVKPDRSLIWNYGLSNSEVEMNINNKTYLLSIPLVCLSILNLFPGDEKLTLSEISARTNIPIGKDLERHLKSLYVPKQAKLLIKEPEDETINSTDLFKFNTAFSSPKSKFKIKVISAKSSADKKELDLIAKDKEKKIQEAVVAVLRPHGQLTHAVLVQRAAHALRPNMKASPHSIKQAIQSLMDRDIIRRDNTESNLYRLLDNQLAN